jgi:hypothetical protein
MALYVDAEGREELVFVLGVFAEGEYRLWSARAGAQSLLEQARRADPTPTNQLDFETLVSAAEPLRAVDVVLDAGKLHLSYYDSNTGQIGYLYEDAQGFVGPESLEVEPDNSFDSSAIRTSVGTELELDAMGRPLLCYIATQSDGDRSQRVMCQRRRASQDWEVVATSSPRYEQDLVEGSLTAAIGPRGALHIVYGVRGGMDRPNELRYLRRPLSP